jgi:hypothetical protein
LHSAYLDVKTFEGSTTGEQIYEDIIAVLQKYHGDNWEYGKFGRYLRENGKEHGYCTDHNLHLVAKLAFDREIVFVCVM